MTNEIIQAVIEGDLEAVKCLDREKISAEMTSDLLEYSIAYNHLDIVKYLLNAGTIPHDSALLQIEPSSKQETINIMLALIDAGVNINSRLEEGETLLMKASAQGEDKFVKLLINAGADVNLLNQNNESALLLSACAGHLEVFNFLAPLTDLSLRKNAEPFLLDGLRRCERNNDQLTSKLIIAAGLGNLESVEEAIAEGVNINSIGSEGNTALFSASAWGHINVVRTLLNNGADPNVGKENDGETPLMIAISNIKLANYINKSFGEKEQLEVVKLLLEAGANIDQRTYDGWNALMIASNANNEDSVRLLLQSGADVYSVNKENKSALYYASNSECKKIVELLERFGATQSL
jgi:uncharacterized protein